MQPADRRWTVSCAACEIVIGFVEGGHFVHDPACAQPLSIGRGTMRCCRCAGRLSVVGDFLERHEQFVVTRSSSLINP